MQQDCRCDGTLICRHSRLEALANLAMYLTIFLWGVFIGVHLN